MKAVEVRNQVRLSAVKCVELVLSGVRFRLFRAAVTVVIIALAGAFLMTILTESLTAREVRTAVEAQTAPRQLFLLWVSRVSSPLRAAELTKELSDGKPSRLAELRAWGALTDEELARLRDVARRQIDRETGCLPFFERLSEGERRPMVGSARGEKILELLSDPQRLKHFEGKLAGIDQPFPVTQEEFRRFLSDWGATVSLRQRILAGHRRAVGEVATKLLRGQRPRLFLAQADDSVVNELRALGYQLTVEELQTIRTQATLALNGEIVEQTLGSPFFKGMLARRRSVKVPKVNAEMLFKEVSSEDGARWLVELTDSAKGLRPLNMSGARVQGVALSQVNLTDEQLAAKLALARRGELSWRGPKLWGGLKDTQMQVLKGVAAWQVTYMGFFGSLSDRDREAMLGPPDSASPFAAVLSQEGFDKLLRELKSLGKELPIPDEAAAAPRKEGQAEGEKAQEEAEKVFRGFLKRWEATRELRQKILSGRGEVLSAIRGVLDKDNAREILSSDLALATALRQGGAGFSIWDLTVVRKQATDTLAARRVAQLLEVPVVRKQFGLRRRLDPQDVTPDALYQELSTEDGSRWFVELLGKLSGLRPLGLTVTQVREAADSRLKESNLAAVEAKVGPAPAVAGGGVLAGLSGRTVWLVIVSFMVCIIGIANAMLMSVTERFREIATMKCLGATDGFIMINFVLESCLQGVVGGTIGAALGFLLGVLRVWAQYGYIALQELPWGQVSRVGLLALGVGLGISALAAVYPAWVAARLAPMEAMRIE